MSKARPICIVFLGTALLLAGCSTFRQETVAEPEPLPPPVLDAETKVLFEPQPVQEPLRTPEALHAYWLGPYVSSDDPTIRHDAHRIVRLEETSRWNLRPAGATAVPLGPVVAVADPARQTEQLSGEMASKIEEANQLIATLIAQNETLLENLAVQEAELAALRQRVTELEN